jgi:hypothetical protein
MALTADQLKVKSVVPENRKPYERPNENKKNLFKKYEEIPDDDSDSEEDMKAYIRWKKRKEQKRKRYIESDDDDDSDFEKNRSHKSRTDNYESSNEKINNIKDSDNVVKGGNNSTT